MKPDDDIDMFGELDSGDPADGDGDTDEIPDTEPQTDYSALDDDAIIALADKTKESGHYAELAGWNSLIREDLDRTKRGDPFGTNTQQPDEGPTFSFDDMDAEAFSALVEAGKTGDDAEIRRIGRKYPGMIEQHFPGLAR